MRVGSALINALVMSSIRHYTLPVLATIVLLAVFLWWLGPTSADIRLDTGDLRYCFYGIPLSHEPMPEPQRSQLLALTKMSRVCIPMWVRCAEFPQSGTNCKECMCRNFYCRGLAWSDEDPNVALAIIEDIALYIKATNAKAGAPESSYLLRYAERTSSGKVRLNSDWKSDPHVQAYIKLRRK